MITMDEMMGDYERELREEADRRERDANTPGTAAYALRIASEQREAAAKSRRLALAAATGTVVDEDGYEVSAEDADEDDDESEE